jgi:hypothetical protein
VIGALLAGGCKGEEQPNSAPVAETAVSRLETRADTAQAFYPEKSFDSTMKLIAHENWDDTPGHTFTGWLDCGDGSTCGSGQERIRFRMRPRNNAHTLDHRKILSGSAEGTFIAEITNTDSVRYGAWKMDPKATVYLWIGPLSTGQRRIALYRIDPATRQSTLVRTAERAVICDIGRVHEFAQIDVYIPWHCDNKRDLQVLYGPPYTPTGSLKTSVGKLASYSVLSAAPPADFDTGVWISCAGGCCEASRFR